MRILAKRWLPLASASSAALTLWALAAARRGRGSPGGSPGGTAPASVLPRSLWL
jgi:hypothetical protein